MSNSLPITIDFEVTNRCNATCYFCPRDATPHEGMMTVEIFDKALERAVEYRRVLKDVLGTESVTASLCGLGEPLLHKNIVSFVEKVKAEGFKCIISSNGSPLTEKKSQALLDAGLDEIFINISDIDEEYEKVYNLPFKRTLDNVTRFAKMAKGRCVPKIVLVDHHDSKEHIKAMKTYWRERGINQFASYSVINRGGALFVDHMQYKQYNEMKEARAQLTRGGLVPTCGVPWIFMFIGYDGNYYLCCSDWRKQGNLGSIFDKDFLDITRHKLEMVTNRSPVCKTCNHDPINRMTEELRARNQGESTDEDVTKLRHILRTAIADMDVDRAKLQAYADTQEVYRMGAKSEAFPNPA